MDSAQHSAIGNLRSMLKDGRAKRLSGLVKHEDAAPAAAPAALAIHIHAPGAGAPEAAPDGDEGAVEGDVHPIMAKVNKRMDQLLRPKKG